VRFHLCIFAHEIAGAARIRHSLLPRFCEGKRNANLGRIPPRDADVYLLFEI
jgi:hypothetical protein